jgi:hypothetical protein
MRASLLVCLLATGGMVSPALAQASDHRADSADRRIAHSNEVAKSARQSFGMAADRAVSDPNMPAATGGGSLGYNRKLLVY